MNQPHNKILFLDLDGVLNTTLTTKNMPICRFHEAILNNEDFDIKHFNFHSSCLENLMHLYAAVPNLSVVIISSWRLNSCTIEHFDKLFKLFKIDGYSTLDMVPPSIYHSSRSKTMKEYLINKSLQNSTYLAIDDHPEFYDKNEMHMYAINPDCGLTFADVNNLQRIFNYETK